MDQKTTPDSTCSPTQIRRYCFHRVAVPSFAADLKSSLTRARMEKSARDLEQRLSTELLCSILREPSTPPTGERSVSSSPISDSRNSESILGTVSPRWSSHDTSKSKSRSFETSPAQKEENMDLDQQAPSVDELNSVFHEAKAVFMQRLGRSVNLRNNIDCLRFGRIEAELVFKGRAPKQPQPSSIESRLKAIEDKLDVNGAFRGAGVRCPKYGVGAKGFNAFDEETGYFYEGVDLPSFKFNNQRLAFRGGALVDLNRKVY